MSTIPEATHKSKDGYGHGFEPLLGRFSQESRSRVTHVRLSHQVRACVNVINTVEMDERLNGESLPVTKVSRSSTPSFYPDINLLISRSTNGHISKSSGSTIGGLTHEDINRQPVQVEDFSKHIVSMTTQTMAAFNELCKHASMHCWNFNTSPLQQLEGQRLRQPAGPMTSGAEEVSASSSSSSRASAQGCVYIRCVRWLALSVCLFVCLGYTEGRAMDTNTLYKQRQTSAVKYLAQFGYLKGPSRETQNLMSMEDLKKAIKTLQKAGNIPPTGVLDLRTMDLMARPRCGNTDDFVDESRGDNDYRLRRKRYTTGSSKWPRTNLTFRFINYTPDMPQATTRQLISDAFHVWSDATPLSFTEVVDSSADIMIQFASQYHSDGYPFDGKGMVLGHAFFPGADKGGDTHFDDDENWTANSTDGVDLFMVAAHEFGHALGLAHSGDPSALMYPWYMGFEGKFKLPEDDLRGIISLYGSGEKDRYLPEKDKKVNMIPDSRPPKNVPYDIDPTVKPKKDDTSNEPPDPCRSHIDALTVIRSEIFIFIGKWFWRMDSRKLIPNPVEIHQFWYGFPKNVSKIDAVFERPDSKIVFFSGDKFWVFNGNHRITNFPEEGRPLVDFIIPADVKRIDAAFVWGYNMRTYLVSGDMYWKMNENNTFVEYDYPRDMRTWKGVPVPVDAAFKDLDGKTYFFQEGDFYEFYDMKMQVKPGYPKTFSRHWLQCPEALRVEAPLITTVPSPNVCSSVTLCSKFLMLLLLLYKFIVR